MAIAAAVAGFFIVGWLQVGENARYQVERLIWPPTIEEDLIAASIAGSRALPQQFNDMTLYRMYAKGKTLNYYYKLPALPKDQEWRLQGAKTIARNACKDSVLKDWLQRGAHLQYHYENVESENVGTIVVSQSDCL